MNDFGIKIKINENFYEDNNNINFIDKNLMVEEIN